MHIWHKNLADGCEAISFLNLRDDGMPRLFNKTLKDLGLAKQVIAVYINFGSDYKKIFYYCLFGQMVTTLSKLQCT